MAASIRWVGAAYLRQKLHRAEKIEKKKRIYKAQYTTYYEKIGEKENKGSFCVKNLLTYVQGLKDLGGALEYGANLTEDLIDAWDTLMGAYDTAVEGGKQVWFAVVHPQLADATYFVGTPAPLGLNEASVGSMLETTLYITPNSAPVMAAKPTEEP